MENVLIVRFDGPDPARAAMGELRQLAGKGLMTWRGAAVVVREKDGRFWTPEDEQRLGFAGLATGGAVGALLGALTGPAGFQLWGAAGASIGSLADAEEADTSEQALASVIREVPPGATVLVADVDEPAPLLVNAAMEKLGGTVVRRSRKDVDADVAAADAALAAARAEAARVMRERRKRAGQQTLGERLPDIKQSTTTRS